MVIEANRAFNLTAITDPTEMAVKHYLDSLTCCLAVDFTKTDSACDIGSGAGFPGIPLAMLFAGTKLTLVESHKKKADFLLRAVKELGLENCQVIAERAETLGQGSLRETFSIVMSRGVAPLPVMAEYCIPLVKIGGVFIAMRGKKGRREVADSLHATRELGGGESSILQISLGDAGERCLITVPKTAPTPARYPRRLGIPEKRPLT